MNAIFQLEQELVATAPNTLEHGILQKIIAYARQDTTFARTIETTSKEVSQCAKHLTAAAKKNASGGSYYMGDTEKKALIYGFYEVPIPSEKASVKETSTRATIDITDFL